MSYRAPSAPDTRHAAAVNETSAPPLPAADSQSDESRNHPSPSIGCSLKLVAVALVSISVLGTAIHSSFNHQIDTKGCVMTYMQPTYYKLLDFDINQTRFASKYALLLYRDEYDHHPQLDQSMLTRLGDHDWAIEKEAKWQPTGVPVLFIPGNAGSARQVRSIAKEASKYYHETIPRERGKRTKGSKPLDFFTVDLNEEFSAFHGNLLLDQALYINKVITYILSLYSDKDQDSCSPTSVILIGHSMGGIVARTIFVQENYLQGSVNTILTIATPHMAAPIALDSQITDIYTEIESFWRAGYQGTGGGALKDVSLVSVMGGNLDITVNSEAGNVQHIIPPSHGFSVFTSHIPHTWVGCDHLSILWCNQVAKSIGRAMVEIVDASLAGQVKHLDERMNVFRRVLLTGTMELSAEKHDSRTLILTDIQHTMVDLDKKWSLSASQGFAPEHHYVLRLVDLTEETSLTILTDYSLEMGSRLEVLLCNELQPFTGRLACSREGLLFAPVPASKATSSMPLFEGEYHTAREFQFLKSLINPKSGFLVIVDRGQSYGGEGFLQVEIRTEAENTITHSTTNKDLIFRGLKTTLEPALSTKLKLPNIDNSLLAYNLKVTRSGCEGSPSKFMPFLRQSSWAMHEDKFLVNILANQNSGRGIDINFHGDLSYFDKAPLSDRMGIELTLWMDQTCDSPMTLELMVDNYGSLGRAVIRYRMALIVFTFMVILLVIRAQLQDWFRGEAFVSFGESMVTLMNTTFLKFSVLLATISTLQSLVAITGHEDYLRELRTQDALLGTNDMFFWFLAPVFFQLAVGIVALVWIALSGLVVAVSWTMRSGVLPKPWSSRSRTILVLSVLRLVSMVIPYPFVFTGCLLVLIASSARVLSVVKKSGSNNAKKALWDQVHWMMSMVVVLFFLLPFAVPVLMVWIRNIAGGWFVSFSSDHRLLKIILIKAHSLVAGRNTGLSDLVGYATQLADL
ncbi:GPI inositol deacylase [Gryganskiella cystojenkinii]|nr:GPI inositol deacylase [Gryganskiella cystojenkinii]